MCANIKKSRLIINYSYDFQLLGICSSHKGYFLAWTLNRILEINLIKIQDLVIEYKKGKAFSYQRFEHKCLYDEITLFRNKPQGTSGKPKMLIPEYPHIDFILMIKDSQKNSGSKILECLQGKTSIELATLIPLGTLTSKDNFIF